MREVWKDIQGYEGMYQVSNKGRVRSVDRMRNSKNHSKQAEKGQILKPLIQDGYCLASLCKEGKMKHYRIHRLVAEAFIPNPDKLPFINHIDENRANNKVDNLEWCTRKYNNSYGRRNEKVRLAKKRNKLLNEIKNKVVLIDGHHYISLGIIQELIKEII